MFRIQGHTFNCFWNWNDDNFPSKELYTELIENGTTLTDNNFGWDNETTATINLKIDENNYTYFTLEHNNRFWGFHVTGERLVTDQIIEYYLTLDVWGTYAIDFLEKNKNEYFIANRSHAAKNYPYWQLEDRLIEEVPKTINGDKIMYSFATYEVEGSYKYFAFKKWRRLNYSQVNNNTLAGNYYYVFKDKAGGNLENSQSYYSCFPLLGNGWQHEYRGVYESVENNLENLENLKNSGDFESQFLGCYFMPNFLNLNMINENYTIMGETIKLAVFELPYRGTNITTRWTPLPNLGSFGNYKEKLANYMYFNNPIKSWQHTQIDNVRYIEGFLVFTNGAKIIANNKNNYNINSIIDFGGELPSSRDEYIAYVNAIKTQTNTGLEHAKDNYITQSAQNVFNTGLGMATNLLSLNIAGFIGAAGGGIFNTAKQGLGYTQGLESLDARFTDVKRTSSMSFASADIKDASFLSLNSATFQVPYVAYEYEDLSDSYFDIINSIWKYKGYAYPLYDTLINLLPNQDFNYVEFDREHITNRLIDKSGLNTNQKNMVMNLLFKGIRIWKTEIN